MKATTNFASDTPTKPKHHPGNRPPGVTQNAWREQVLKDIYQPPGTLLDDPEVWRLCRQGVATPADEECKAATGMTDEQLAEAKENYRIRLENQFRSTGSPRYDAPPAPSADTPSMADAANG